MNPEYSDYQSVADVWWDNPQQHMSEYPEGLTPLMLINSSQDTTLNVTSFLQILMTEIAEREELAYHRKHTRTNLEFFLNSNLTEFKGNMQSLRSVILEIMMRYRKVSDAELILRAGGIVSFSRKSIGEVTTDDGPAGNMFFGTMGYERFGQKGVKTRRSRLPTDSHFSSADIKAARSSKPTTRFKVMEMPPPECDDDPNPTRLFRRPIRAPQSSELQTPTRRARRSKLTRNTGSERLGSLSDLAEFETEFRAAETDKILSTTEIEARQSGLRKLADKLIRDERRRSKKKPTNNRLPKPKKKNIKGRVSRSAIDDIFARAGKL